MKRKLIILGANAMAALMDFGIGALIAAVVAIGFDVILPWYLLVIGGVLALVPDFDLVPAVLSGKSAAFDHRQTLFHRPFLVIPLTALMAFYFGGEMWAIIATVCVFYHYLHDTNFVDTTYGIAWLWPFSDQYWTWSGSFIANPGTPHHDWLEIYWLKPSFLSVHEVAVGLLSLITAGFITGVTIPFLVLTSLCLSVGVFLVWSFGTRQGA